MSEEMEKAYDTLLEEAKNNDPVELRGRITELEQQLAVEKEIVQSTFRAYKKTKAKLTERDNLLDDCEGAFEQLASQCIGFRVSENQDIVELMVRYATAWLTKLRDRK